MNRQQAIDHARKVIVAVGGDKAKKSKWMAEFDQLYGIVERFPHYPPAVLYSEACARAGTKPVDWPQLDEQVRVAFHVLKALAVALEPLIVTGKPAPGAHFRNRRAGAMNRAAGRVADDDGDDDPRARNSLRAGRAIKPGKTAKK